MVAIFENKQTTLDFAPTRIINDAELYGILSQSSINENNASSIINSGSNSKYIIISPNQSMINVPITWTGTIFAYFTTV
jgi:hypothetical protein